MPEPWPLDLPSLPPSMSHPDWETYRKAVWHSGNLSDRLRVVPRRPPTTPPPQRPAPAARQESPPPQPPQAPLPPPPSRSPGPPSGTQLPSPPPPLTSGPTGRLASYAPYLALLRDPDPTIREAGLEHLERLGDPGCLDALREMLRHDEIPALQYRAFQVIEALGHAWTESDWLDLLSSRSGLVRKQAIARMQDSDDPAWLPHLEQLAQAEPTPVLREQAAQAVIALKRIRAGTSVAAVRAAQCRCQSVGFISCASCGFNFNWQDARYCGHCGQALTVEASRQRETHSVQAGTTVLPHWPDAILARGTEVVKALDMLVRHRRITEQQLINALGNRRIAHRLSSVLHELRDLLGFEVVIETDAQGKLFRIP